MISYFTKLKRREATLLSLSKGKKEPLSQFSNSSTTEQMRLTENSVREQPDFV